MIVPLVAAAWLPPTVPHLLRQALLCVWGVGAILFAERLLFSSTVRHNLRAVGLSRARVSTLAAAVIVCLPVWAFLPLTAWTRGLAVDLRSDWLQLLIGVVLVNGIMEEVMHRGFVFGHLRAGRSFAAAATLSAIVFAAQHLYLFVTMGWMVGAASVMLAALLAYPLAFIFEHGGNSIAGPAILHTSANAPAIILAVPQDFAATALVAHMGVTLLSLCLVFCLAQFPSLGRPTAV